MIKKIKQWIVNFITAFNGLNAQDDLTGLLKQQIERVDALRVETEEALRNANVVYTTVRSFNSGNGDKVFWPWVRSVLLGDEYRYLMFSRKIAFVNLCRPQKWYEYTKLTGNSRCCKLLMLF